VGYSDGYISQLSVERGENIVVSFGDDGRVMAIIAAEPENWDLQNQASADGCLGHAAADVLFYPEFSPGDVGTERLEADCCVQ